MAGPKSAMLQHKSEVEIAEENNYRVLEKYVRLVAVTGTSPKVNWSLEEKNGVLGV